jgi:hypothetical protein
MFFVYLLAITKLYLCLDLFSDHVISEEDFMKLNDRIR